MVDVGDDGEIACQLGGHEKSKGSAVLSEGKQESARKALKINSRSGVWAQNAMKI